MYHVLQPLKKLKNALKVVIWAYFNFFKTSWYYKEHIYAKFVKIAILETILLPPKRLFCTAKGI